MLVPIGPSSSVPVERVPEAGSAIWSKLTLPARGRYVVVRHAREVKLEPCSRWG